MRERFNTLRRFACAEHGERFEKRRSMWELFYNIEKWADINTVLRELFSRLDVLDDQLLREQQNRKVFKVICEKTMWKVYRIKRVQTMLK